MNDKIDNGRSLDLRDFEQLVEALGSDPARWPVERRSAAMALLATRVEARSAFAQARALDRVLAVAPAPDAHRRRALASRIVAMAEADAAPREVGVAQSSAGNVIPLPLAKTATKAAASEALAVPARSRVWASVGSALAASLVLGLLIGGALPSFSVFDFADDDEQIVLAIQNDGLAALLDEDAL